MLRRRAVQEDENARLRLTKPRRCHGLLPGQCKVIRQAPAQCAKAAKLQKLAPGQAIAQTSRRAKQVEHGCSPTRQGRIRQGPWQRREERWRSGGIVTCDVME